MYNCTFNKYYYPVQRYLFAVRSTVFSFTTLADTTLELGRIGISLNRQNDFANGMQIFCAMNVLIGGIILEIRDLCYWILRLHTNCYIIISTIHNLLI